MGKNGKLSWSERLGYGLAAGISTDVPWAMLGYFLMYYYTDVFGISAITAGTIMLCARCFDAFTDLLMGWAVDTQNLRWGKYRSWILMGSIVATVLLIAVFTNAPLGSTGKIVYAAITYGCYGAIGMTLLFIPMSSQCPNMTNNPEERALLAGIRSIAANGGTMLVVVGFMPMVRKLGGESESRGFFFTTVVIALGIMLLLFWNLKVTRKYELNEDGSLKAHLMTTEHENPLKQLSALAKNRPAMVTVIGILILNIMMCIRSGFLTYMFQYYFKIPEFESIALFALLAMAAVGGFLFQLIVKLFHDDTNLAFVTTMLVSAVSNFLFYFIVRGMDPETAAKSMQFGPLFFLFAFNGLLQGIHYAFPFLVMQNAVEYGVWKTGKRQPGIIFCCMGFSQTIGGALGGQVLGIILSVAGYVPGESQGAATLAFMLFGAFCIPAILTLAQGIIQMFYGLNGKRFKEISAEIAARGAES